MHPTPQIALLLPALLLLAGTAHAVPGRIEAGAATASAPQAHAMHEGHEGQPVHPEHAAHGGREADGRTDVAADHDRWATDAPLREGMRRMRDAIAGADDVGPDRLDPARARSLATAVDQAAAFMFANCTLDPAPDAALHGLLGRLMAGAQALRQAPGDSAALAPMRAVLVDYGRLFDDPDFAVDAPAQGTD